MAFDSIDYDVPQNALSPEVHETLAEQEITENIQELIKNQYQYFDDLGTNYYSEHKNLLSFDGKVEILRNLISYVDGKILPISDIENIDDGVERLMFAGEYIYEFICVDNVSSLIPALMETLNITNVDEFDILINTKYSANPGKFKTDYLKVIQMTIEQLLKLQNITPVVKNDENYQRLLGKYYYYQELIDYGDLDMFLTNFIRPIVSKYSSDLLWKLL